MNELRVKNVKKKKSKRFSCDQCPKFFSDRGSLKKHLPTHSTETPYPCSLCAYAGKTRQYLRRHVKVTHERDRRFECEECGKTFHYGCKLKDHMRVHTGEKPNKCDVCGKAFNSSYSLSTHKLIHTGSKPFQCAFCQYACRDSSTLRKHQARHMGTEKYYQCTMCSTSLKSKSNLKLHVAEKHLNIDVSNYICDVCGKRFKVKSALSVHIQAVHERSRTTRCDVCGVLLSDRSNLPAHMRIHVDQKPYFCTVELCDKRFKHTSSLTKHIRWHYPSKQFRCAVCSRRFLTNKSLQRHLNTHRAKVKRVECDYCGVRFYNKNYLVRHIQRKHSRKKQKFICDMCDFKTTNKPSLVMHIKYGHDVSHFFRCEVCEKKFKRDYNLKIHYWTAHEIKFKIPERPKKKPKKPIIKVKDEPQDYGDVNEYFEVVPKIEPLDDEGMLLADLASTNEGHLQDVPKNVFEELIDEREKRPDDNIHPQKAFVDQTSEEQVRKGVRELLEKTRKKVAALALERARRKYNRLMRKAVQKRKRKRKKLQRDKGMSLEDLASRNAHLQDVPKNVSEGRIDQREKRPDNNIHSKTVTHDNNNEQDTNSLLVEDYSISHDAIEKESTIDKPEATGIKETIDNQITEEENTTIDIGTTEELNDTREVGQNRKLKINTHQCYVCFKLFDTKENLLEHCKDHFDLSNVETWKKCPLCKYSTNRSLTRHLRNAHNLNIKVPYGTFKDRGNAKGPRYYYDVGHEVVDKIEIIPSINNLNRRESIKIDKNNRDSKNKSVMKTKLVRKGKEWIVLKEKIKINAYLLPKFDKVGNLNVKGGYIDRMKALSRAAKKNGVKMLFPCDACDKICQTLAALKLHGRKHQTNPTPYKPKVWKHKAKKPKDQSNCKQPVKPSTEKLPEGGKLAHRNAKPKPVVTKHRCEKELIEFYERNIKGGDIEFWQFLKIYNKMGRDNVSDLSELDKTNGYGVPCTEHGNESAVRNEKECEVRNKDSEVRNRTVRRGAFQRVVRLTKKEVLRRNAIKMKLRQQIKNNT